MNGSSTSQVSTTDHSQRERQPVRIRLAKPLDADDLHRLICELAVHQGTTKPLPVTSKILRTQLESKDCPFECLIAESQNRVVGFALFFRTYSTWEGRPCLYLDDLYIDPARRGDGIGRMLLQRLAQIALERGYGRIDWVVLESNQSVSSFYRKLGATEIPEWHHWRLQHSNLHSLAMETLA